MRVEVVFAGFGGQGVIKAALLLAVAAGLYEGKEVAQTQSYGPEARGGACRSEVIISDEAIDYIKTRRIDALIVMSQPALDKFIGAVDRQRTMVIADTTLIRSWPDGIEKLFAVEATRLAEQEFGHPLYANILMLGSFAAITRLIALESLERALEGNVPAATLDRNRLALKKGHALGARLISPPAH